MDRAGLEQRWRITRARLTSAAALLPSDARAAQADASLVAYNDYLEHNELELALDELEFCGRTLAASDAFWASLAQAAESMGLTDRASRYREAS